MTHRPRLRCQVASRRHELELVPIGFVDRMSSCHLRAGQVDPVDPDARERTRVDVLPDPLDRRVALRRDLKGGLGCEGVARGAVPTFATVAGQFGGVDPEKADGLFAAAEGVPVDGDEGAGEHDERHATMFAVIHEESVSVDCS